MAPRLAAVLVAAIIPLAVLLVPDRRAPVARVEPEPGARFARHNDDGGEFVRLRRGAATFDVDDLDPGGRFEVRVGPDAVRVHGTRFRVVARAGRLASVRVWEGVVQVFRHGVAVAMLEQGEEWRAPTAVAAGADPRSDTESPAGTVQAPVQLEASAVDEAPEPLPDPSSPRSARGRSADRESQTPSSGAGASPRTQSFDHRFMEGWRALSDGDIERAHARFIELSERSDAGGREPDVLFWLAQAELRLGRRAAAARRLTALLEHHPTYLRASDARAQLRSLVDAQTSESP